jgi:hypothetical protein
MNHKFILLVIVSAIAGVFCGVISVKSRNSETKSQCEKDCRATFSSTSVSSHVSRGDHDEECWCIVENAEKGIRIW